MKLLPSGKHLELKIRKLIFVIGPLSSVLSVKYSYRTVTLLGGTFAAAGMMLSYFANSVAFLCVR